MKTQNTFVIGLGVTGLSVARFLKTKNVDFTLLDSRDNPPEGDEFKKNYPNVPVHCGEFELTQFENARLIILSPGVDPNQSVLTQLRERGVELIGDIELFARYNTTPVLAITGTNGKSTVTAWLSACLERAGFKVGMGGNIGPPALDLLSQSDLDCMVLELSSFQLEMTTSLKSLAATVLNVTDDHLDRHHTLEKYASLKRRIYQGTHCAIYNVQDQLTTPDVSVPETFKFSSQLGDTADFYMRETQGKRYLCHGDQAIDIATLALPGMFNVENAMAVWGLANAMKVPFDIIQTSLQHFDGLPHRCVLVKKIHGVLWFNDSKATNTGAVLAAINGFAPEYSKRIILIAGGQGKGADFTTLHASCAQHVKTCYVYGEDKALIVNAIETACEVQQCDDLNHAIHTVYAHAKPGECVLFSPACASFDMFDNFVHRGEIFTQLVHALPEQEQ